MGRAVTAQAMPTPSTNCQDWPCDPNQHSFQTRRSTAAKLPVSSGVPSARPAAMVVSRRFAQTCARSSSIPAIQTNSMTAHQAMPFKDCTTGALKTNA